MPVVGTDNNGRRLRTAFVQRCRRRCNLRTASDLARRLGDVLAVVIPNCRCRSALSHNSIHPKRSRIHGERRPRHVRTRLWTARRLRVGLDLLRREVCIHGCKSKCSRRLCGSLVERWRWPRSHRDHAVCLDRSHRGQSIWNETGTSISQRLHALEGVALGCRRCLGSGALLAASRSNLI